MVNANKTTSLQFSLEDSLCSRGRLRVLKLLDESPMLNTSQIAAKLGMSYLLAREHLEFLENADLLTHVKFGKRIRFYKFKESAKATTVKNLIEAWRDT